MTKVLGTPCWYELMTAEGQLDAAGQFYGAVLGWTVADAGMEGFTYHLAKAGEAMVAGVMGPPPDAPDMPPFWMVYFAVDDGDAAVAAIRAAGGSIFRELNEIPGTGRFAICADPQGAAFGILEPIPMDSGPPAGGAWDQSKPGHGNWHELMSTDPAAGLKFYGEIFGWTASTAMDMGEMGTYQIFAHKGTDIGGMMGLGMMPAPCWLPYFGVPGITAAVEGVTNNGGSVLHGPVEVPGGAMIAVAKDPQGAVFAVVGPNG